MSIESLLQSHNDLILAFHKSMLDSFRSIERSVSSLTDEVRELRLRALLQQFVHANPQQQEIVEPKKISVDSVGGIIKTPASAPESQKEQPKPSVEQSPKPSMDQVPKPAFKFSPWEIVELKKISVDSVGGATKTSAPESQKEQPNDEDEEAEEFVPDAHFESRQSSGRLAAGGISSKKSKSSNSKKKLRCSQKVEIYKVMLFAKRNPKKKGIPMSTDEMVALLHRTRFEQFKNVNDGLIRAVIAEKQAVVDSMYAICTAEKPAESDSVADWADFLATLGGAK